MDAHSGAEKLLSSILSATTPPLISAAVDSTHSYLHLHPPEHCRPFFSLAFPAFLSRLFFPSQSSPAWIDIPDLHALLQPLLHPSGPLFSAVLRHSLLRYSFPLDRLPLWIPHALPHAHALPHPLLRSRALPDPPQLRLSVLDYYLFWFAYHPLSKAFPSPPAASDSNNSRLHKWTSNLPAISNTWRRGSLKRLCSLYPRLLYAYLQTFVPLRNSHCHVEDATIQQAEFVLSVFVQFWMVDNDFSPLPVRVWESVGVRFPLRKISADAPPTPGLGDVLEVLIKYVNSGLVGPAEEGGRLELGGGIRNPAKLWNSMMQRPLYRYILRSFLFCPLEVSTKNVRQVFLLWTIYLEPWRIREDEFNELELPGKQPTDVVDKGKDKSGPEFSYNPLWSDYVADNYLFYSSLLVHFLGFAHKFLHVNVDMVVEMTLKVICILTSSRQLLHLLKEIDAAYQSKNTRSSSFDYSTSHKHVPSIREQLQDWEDGLYESEVDGSFSSERWNHELELFSESEDGASHLLQLLILRAESELRTISSNNLETSQNLESLKSQMHIVFGQIRTSLSQASPKASTQMQGREVMFSPSVGRHLWPERKYRGNQLKRPISDNEVAWLARLLVRLSDFLNEFLGLNGDSGNDRTGSTYIDVNSLNIEVELGSKEAVWKLLKYVIDCLAMLSQALLKFMRSHGWRINLRVFASKKIVSALLFCTFVGLLRRIL